jgi:transcriptional regulator with XRE-family HTH domain
MREAKYVDIGMQMKAIRERLNWTLETMSKATGISRSYISEFERGFKLPTAKYMRYLHDTHNVSLNFVFGSDGRMFRPTEEEGVTPDFGRYAEDIDELLYYLSRVPHALYSVLGFFAQYKIEHRELVKEYLKEKVQSTER